MNTNAIAWRKSSRSSSGGNVNCVEVGSNDSRVALRDSKNPHGGMLAVDVGEWSRLLHSLSRD